MGYYNILVTQPKNFLRENTEVDKRKKYTLVSSLFHNIL